VIGALASGVGCRAAGEPEPRRAGDTARLEAALRAAPVVRAQTPRTRARLAGAMPRARFAAGETLSRGYFWVFCCGAAGVWERGQRVRAARAGDAVGAATLLQYTPAPASPAAAARPPALAPSGSFREANEAWLRADDDAPDDEPCVAWRLGPSTFRALVSEPAARARAEKVAFLQSAVPQLAVELGAAATAAFADSLREEAVRAGCAVLTEGDAGADRFYIVRSGELVATKRGESGGRAGGRVGGRRWADRPRVAGGGQAGRRASAAKKAGQQRAEHTSEWSTPARAHQRAERSSGQGSGEQHRGGKASGGGGTSQRPPTRGEEIDPDQATRARSLLLLT
jgi:hypothetical protein